MRYIALVLALLLPACAFGTVRYGSGGDIQQFRTLEAGKATKTDVVALAGPPIAKAPREDGGEIWTYSWNEAQSTGFVLPFYYSMDTRSKATAALLFFRGEILERIEWP